MKPKNIGGPPLPKKSSETYSPRQSTYQGRKGTNRRPWLWKHLRTKAEWTPPQTFHQCFALLAARAHRCGVAWELFLTLTVAEIREVLEDAAQEWIAKEQPANNRIAELLAMTANCHRKKGAPAFKAAHFLPKKPVLETPEQEAARVMAGLLRLT